MMLDRAFAAAQVVPYGSAPSHAAIGMCMLRGIDPFACPPPVSGVPACLENWRLAIVEELLREMLRRELPL